MRLMGIAFALASPVCLATPLVEPEVSAAVASPMKNETERADRLSMPERVAPKTLVTRPAMAHSGDFGG